MTKPELPPLPAPFNYLTWNLTERWGLACYRAGLLRAAEMCKGVILADLAASDIRAEADKEEQ